jgi:hypothetical protein
MFCVTACKTHVFFIVHYIEPAVADDKALIAWRSERSENDKLASRVT